MNVIKVWICFCIFNQMNISFLKSFSGWLHHCMLWKTCVFCWKLRRYNSEISAAIKFFIFFWVLQFCKSTVYFAEQVVNCVITPAITERSLNTSLWPHKLARNLSMGHESLEDSCDWWVWLSLWSHAGWGGQYFSTSVIFLLLLNF